MNLLMAILNFSVVAWFLFEISLSIRSRREARAKNRNSRGSGYLNFIGIILGLTAAVNLSGIHRFCFPGGKRIILYFIGLALMVIGFLIRIWAIRVLGDYFSASLETKPGQQVVKHGPYRLIRHPSYAGALLLCCGFGLAQQNWLSLAAAVVLPLIAFIYRITVEERLLISSLGSEYREYQRHTKRLIPWIW
jgi:protein-S-isoprenylcysteine O-methyltransferase Ste14